MNAAPRLALPGTARGATAAGARTFGAADLGILSRSDAPPGPMPPGDASARAKNGLFSAGRGVPLLGTNFPEGTPDPGPGNRPVPLHGAPDAALDRSGDLDDGGRALAPFGRTVSSVGLSPTSEFRDGPWTIPVQPIQAAPAQGDLSAPAH